MSSIRKDANFETRAVLGVLVAAFAGFLAAAALDLEAALLDFPAVAALDLPAPVLDFLAAAGFRLGFLVRFRATVSSCSIAARKAASGVCESQP
jgi:hypothetical protein